MKKYVKTLFLFLKVGGKDRKHILPVCLTVFFLFSLFNNTVWGAVVMHSDTMLYKPDTIFRFNNSMTFTYVEINDDYFKFNSSVFNTSSDGVVDITLDRFLPSPGVNVDAVVFSANNSVNGTVWFYINGFNSGDVYKVFRDDTALFLLSVNETGYIYFSNDLWSTHNFTVTQMSSSSINYTGNASAGFKGYGIGTLVAFGIMVLVLVVAVPLLFKRRSNYRY